MTFPLKPTAPTFIPSPCVSLCRMNAETDLCEGCLRSIDEIVAWSSAHDAYKVEVWHKINLRKSGIDLTA